MGTLYVTEYARMAQVDGHQAMPDETSRQADYSISITASSTTPSAPNATFQPTTRYVRLKTDSTGACCVQLGVSPTAVTTAGHMSASQTEYRGVPSGGSYTVAVITASAP